MNREFRDTLAYILGGLGFLHELLIAQAERPFLLTASLALMGFPLVFKADQRAQVEKMVEKDIELAPGGKEGP